MKQYNVTGMSCAACSARVEKAVGKVPGVTSCSVNLLTNSMGVEGDVEESEIIIPVEFETIKNEIYTILSKGVHEYEEDECLGLYEAVKYVIERLLDIELEKKENAKKTSEVLKAIKDKLRDYPKFCVKSIQDLQDDI